MDYMDQLLFEIYGKEYKPPKILHKKLNKKQKKKLK